MSQVSTLTGIFKTHPALALAFAFCLFSIAGVPPFVGFFAKLGVLFSALNGGYIFMALVAVVVSIVSASYYLRVVRVMFFETKNITARVF